MDTIEIEPGQAIGTIKLGMSRDEVEECIRQYASRYECRDDISFDFSSYFMPEYDSNDRLIALQMTSDVKEHAHCLCHGFHVFRTKADDLVEALDKISPYSRTWDASAGFCYLFTEMGLTLYRSRVFTEKDLEEEWFLAQSLDAQEDDRRFFYFETVSVCEWSYYERLKELEGTANDSELSTEEPPASGSKSSEELILELKRKHGLI
ncbi:hypothetical protein [Paenibacillus dendritiformis]|uniref:Uncharacterized protein n=1 Tax=Paenibacillus dendritiformis C454 TaxID=1131935 RepID=H3SHK0_9BACL|nr:hypothetical protein [Paenibacillus dendritiformis]EHQ61460.1 hypothetical protein PDENDC454_15067 [Paenibacillus dendritiformis C454]CAH8772974.1 hypothetical protein H7S4_005721 [Paenibacillus dendritiformis]